MNQDVFALPLVLLCVISKHLAQDYDHLIDRSMTLQESNIKFITAVLNWLSLFPDSTITSSTHFSKLSNPDVIVEILQLIIDSSFGVDYADFTIEKEMGVIDAMNEYDLIFQSVKSYYKSNLINRKKLYKYLGLLNFKTLYEGDLSSLNCLCFILVEIGLHCYKSSVAISLISLLGTQDEQELKNFMYDEDDLNCKNLILNQKLNLLELENGKLKDELQLKRKELNELQNAYKLSLKDDEGLIQEYTRGISLQNEEIKELKNEILKLKMNNDQLKLENFQLNADFEIIKEMNEMKLKDTLPIIKNNNNKLNKVVKNSTFDLLKWEYNLMNEWIGNLERKKLKL